MTITAGTKAIFTGIVIMLIGYAGFILVNETAGYWAMSVGWVVVAIGFVMHLRAGRSRK